MQVTQRVLKAALGVGVHVRGKAATHQVQNTSLQLLIVAGLGIFQGRVKLEVCNSKRQGEQEDPNRQLLGASAAGSCPGNVAGSRGSSFRAGN